MTEFVLQRNQSNGRECHDGSPKQGQHAESNEESHAAAPFDGARGGQPERRRRSLRESRSWIHIESSAESASRTLASKGLCDLICAAHRHRFHRHCGKLTVTQAEDRHLRWSVSRNNFAEASNVFPL